MEFAPRKSPEAIIAIMGATGTGKSTFIKHLTGDTEIVIGHKSDSETSDVKTFSYIDPKTGTLVTLVDTPGFDDSREGITDTDILEKIAAFLQKGGGRKLNGIIYMYRISDVRAGGMSRKNLRMFKELCGDDRLSNVRIVGTNWDRVNPEEGNEREGDLADGPFRPLLNAGAKMTRQDKGMTSALLIMSELVPKQPVMLKITAEMNSGKSLGETSAGQIIMEEIAKLQRKHEEELRELRKELEQAAAAKKNELRAELAAEQKALMAKVERAANDRLRLQQTHIEELQKKLESQERDRELDRDQVEARDKERDRIMSEKIETEMREWQEKESELVRALSIERSRERQEAAEREKVLHLELGEERGRREADQRIRELERQLADTQKRLDQLASQRQQKDACIIC